MFEGLIGAYSSHFADNAEAVWDGGRSGGEGIQAALAFFREQQVAATRADVVGHSMGGVLPRVYARGAPASETPGPPGANWYLRRDNWGRGDINRLITIGATHRGSHVPRLASHYWKHADDETLSQISSARIQGEVTRSYLDIRTAFRLGKGASTDQDPDSDALRALTETPVRAHTIAGIATVEDMKLFAGGLFDPSYRDRFMITWPMTLEPFLDTLFADHAGAEHSLDGLEDARSIRERLISIRDESERVARLRAKIDHNEALEQQWRGNRPPGVPLTDSDRQGYQQLADDSERLRNEIRLSEENIAAKQEQAFVRYVAATFWNDWTDFTSTLDSQLNGQSPDSPYVTVLPSNYRRACSGILHGYEPRHVEIQKRVIELLQGGLEPFAEKLDRYQTARYRTATEERWKPHEELVPPNCEPPQWKRTP
jgi:hypothetical protein